MINYIINNSYTYYALEYLIDLIGPYSHYTIVFTVQYYIAIFHTFRLSTLNT